ncbi:MAG: PPOX class F420-dependent oxidoreductase, partial [Oscillochloris sp.]|nr:PPOX class F420-dependent oxidoreductase [Oscillochloris sp.]
RRTGEAVPTTVWFAAMGDRIYLTTQGHSGKIKRLRANPQVTVAPSDRVGNLSGSAAVGQARILEAREAEQAEAALRAKYGEQYLLLVTQLPINSVRVFIEVTPAAQEG